MVMHVTAPMGPLNGLQMANEWKVTDMKTAHIKRGSKNWKFSLFLGGAMMVAAAMASHASRADDAAADPLAYDAIMAQDWSTAEAILRDSVAKQPEDPMLLLNLAYVMTSTGRQAEAMALYEKVLTMDKNPMVAVTSGEGRRAKAIAKDSMAALNQGAQ